MYHQNEYVSLRPIIEPWSESLQGTPLALAGKLGPEPADPSWRLRAPGEDPSLLIALIDDDVEPASLTELLPPDPVDGEHPATTEPYEEDQHRTLDRWLDELQKQNRLGYRLAPWLGAAGPYGGLEATPSAD